MDTLIQDTIDFLKEVARTKPTILATREEVNYFAPVIPKKKVVAPPPPPPPTFVPKTPEPVVVKQPTPALPPKKNTHETRLMVEKTFPDMVLRETPLEDSHARKMSRLWEETYLNAQIVVIAFGEVGPGLEFLKNVTKAIDELIAPAQLIEGSMLEREKSWELLLNSPALRNILCSPWNAWKTTTLATHYRQNGATQEQFLGKHPLFLMEPSVNYLKHPERKRILWQLIHTQLSS